MCWPWMSSERRCGAYPPCSERREGSPSQNTVRGEVRPERDRHFPQPSLRTFYIFLSLHFVLSTETTTVLQPFSGKFSQGRGVPILVYRPPFFFTTLNRSRTPRDEGDESAQAHARPLCEHRLRSQPACPCQTLPPMSPSWLPHTARMRRYRWQAHRSLRVDDRAPAAPAVQKGP